MLVSSLLKEIEEKFSIKKIELNDTANIPHLGIIDNGIVIDYEHDYKTLQAILEIYTGETNECDAWEGKKYLFIFSNDGEQVSEYKLMGISEKLCSILSEC